MMLFSFINISSKILLHVLVYSSLHGTPYFGTRLPKAVAVKSLKNFLAQKLLCCGTKNVVTLTHWGDNKKHFFPTVRV
jgi:hypothetical protein